MPDQSLSSALPPVDASALKTADETRPRGVTLRAVLLGVLAVALVALVTPYNDYIVVNTFFIGSYLPLSLVLALFVLVILVNAPLHKWAPRHALSGGELATLIAMMLVGCSIPSQGLLRYWLPMLVAPQYFAEQNNAFAHVFESLNLPAWLFPAPAKTHGQLSTVVQYFYGRVPYGEHAPYLRWIMPLAIWGVFIAALWTTCIALALLVRAQWATNERLAFPLAQVQLALIEPPQCGRALNNLFRSRSFWIAMGGVFILHNLSALHTYFPTNFPKFELAYHLSDVFTEEPWVYLPWAVKNAGIYFTFIGVMYFIQSRIGFSLWATFLLIQLLNMQLRSASVEVAPAAWTDQHTGASAAYILGVLWVGRRQWVYIVRQAFWGRTQSERRQNRMGYRGPFFTAIGGIIIMLVWLSFVGVGMKMGVLIIVFLLLAHLVVTRIVAETGLPFYRYMGDTQQVITNLPVNSFTGRDIFFSQTMTMMGPYASRESIMTFALHGFRVADGAASPTRRRSLVGAMGLALVISFVCASASSLWCYYNYSNPLINQEPFVNTQGLYYKPREALVDTMSRYQAGQWVAQKHSTAVHMSIGAGITGLLQLAAMRSSAWPFLPVGYVVSATWYMQMAWFSLFLGWLAKVLILKFGGARGFQNARPFFIGMIFGEALAAALWLVINLTLALNGEIFKPIAVLPL